MSDVILKPIRPSKPRATGRQQTYVYVTAPELSIGENGNWFINGQDTGVHSKGPEGERGPEGLQGIQGEPGVSVTKVEQVESSTISSGKNVVRFTLSDGTTSDATVYNGEQGESGITESEVIALIEERLKNVSDVFMGTRAEYDAASAAGEIPDGTIVVITDEDDETSTTSVLGEAILGQMILG